MKKRNNRILNIIILIMSEEDNISARNNNLVVKHNRKYLDDQIKEIHLLYTFFKHIDKKTIRDIYNANNRNITTTIMELRTTHIEQEELHNSFDLLMNSDSFISKEVVKDIKRGLIKEKFQEINGPCWAFEAIATIEETLSKRNMLQCPLSEMNLLQWVHKKDVESGYHLKMTSGGNIWIAAPYFLSGYGPCREDECQFNINNNENYTYFTPYCSVRAFKLLDSKNDDIKKALIECGAVSCNITNHSISIYGWNNDNWLIRDSGKVINGKDIFSSLSFSTELMNCVCFPDIRLYDENEKIYQYDDYQFTLIPFKNRNIMCSNVFDFKRGDVLDSVMVYTESKGYRMSIYIGKVDDKGKPICDKRKWLCVKKDYIIPFQGYFSVECDNKIRLTRRCAVIVAIRGKNAQIGVCLKSKENRFVIYETNTNSYLFNGREFENIQQSEYMIRNNIYSFCIKAIVKTHNKENE